MQGWVGWLDGWALVLNEELLKLVVFLLVPF